MFSSNNNKKKNLPGFFTDLLINSTFYDHLRYSKDNNYADKGRILFFVKYNK